MDLYSAANIIIPCITLGVALFTPGVSKILDRVLFFNLSITIVTETMGWLLTSWLLPNFFIYNLYMPIIFIAQNFLFYKLRQQNKKVFVLTSLIIMSIWLLEVGMEEGLNQVYFFYTYVAGTLILLVNVYEYIVFTMNSADVVKIEKSRYFWISIGILVFYIPFLPVMMGVKYSLIQVEIYRAIVFLLVILQHTSFIIGLRWGNRI